jgi:TonB family protein
MSVDPRDSTGDVWAKCLGQVVNGAFRLRRYLGSSAHSVVFLAERDTAERSDVALKLVPAIAERAESLLSDWRVAAGLAQPHLISLLGSGRCHLDRRPYVYVVMEYADQTLAQLLRHRALTDDEAREMLLPTLNALVFLHERGLVQGNLKPANILAVGEQLKVASDTIRRADDAGAGRRAGSVYDPPEARDGSYSTAGDIWGLGVSLFEALTRGAPTEPQARGRAAVLPADFSPTFREVVARCLSADPADRPKATEIEAWARGRSVPPAVVPTLNVAATAAPITRTPPPRNAATPRQVPPAADTPRPQTSHAVAARTGELRRALREASQRRSLIPLVLGVVAVLALGGMGLRALTTHRSPTTPVAQGTQDASPPTAGSAAPQDAKGASPPALAASGSRAAIADAAAVPAVVHEVIPDVPRHARQTIHGHVKVSVRVIVDKEGTVVAALVDDPGPSRYFERLAREAARKWTFPPADAEATRLKLVRFEFSRDGTKGHAVSLQ